MSLAEHRDCLDFMISFTENRLRWLHAKRAHVLIEMAAESVPEQPEPDHHGQRRESRRRRLLIARLLNKAGPLMPSQVIDGVGDGQRDNLVYHDLRWPWFRRREDRRWELTEEGKKALGEDA